MLSLKGVHKSFGKNHVLKGVDVEFSKAGIFAIIGPNGSGKTTVIKTILGMVIPNKGKIQLQGKNIIGEWRYRDQIDYVPQIARFPENLTVYELISMIKDIHDGEKNAQSLIDLFGIEKFIEKRLGNLSGGMRQKVNLLLALMYDSPIIILDEPTAGLDPIALIKLKELLNSEKRKGKIILITTHIMGLVEELADGIVFLLDGVVMFNGSQEQLKLEYGGDNKNLQLPTCSLLMRVRQLLLNECQITRVIRILKYSFYDLVRSWWIYLYFGFFLIFTSALFVLGYDVSKVVISLTNVILLFCPLIATMLGVMYYYNSREFIELLLAQPIRRRDIFLGQYLGLALSLSGSLLAGIGLPFIIFGLFESSEIWNFNILLVVGCMLSFSFSALAYWIALLNENRLIGFAMAIMTWLFFAVIYDGIFLLLLSFFKEYPLDKLALGFSLLNPIDLSRILILLKLDISALMGFTGAVFNKFFGSTTGMTLSLLALLLWVLLPILAINRQARKKDF